MRFYLDNDVDHGCRAVIESAGHDCWATSQAGRSDAEDADQTWYACEMRAVVITHDAGYTATQKRNTAGRHIRLCCEQPDGPKILAYHLADILPILEHRAYVVIEVKRDGFRTHTGWR